MSCTHCPINSPCQVLIIHIDEDFLRNFRYTAEHRIFGPEWQVAQLWAAFEVGLSWFSSCRTALNSFIDSVGPGRAAGWLRDINQQWGSQLEQYRDYPITGDLIPQIYHYTN